MAQLENPNRLLADAYIRHQIYLLKYSQTLSNSIWKLLVATEGDVKSKILSADIASDYMRSKSGRSQFNGLIDEIIAVRTGVWSDAWGIAKDELGVIAGAEAKFAANATSIAAPVVINPSLPSVAMLSSIVAARPFEGRLLKDWFADIEEREKRMITAQLQLGLTAGETNRQLTTRIFGATALSNNGGALPRSYSNLSAIVRTAVAHVASEARNEFALANSDLFDEEEFDATLDGRTTPICRSLDKKVYKIGVGPRPPLHVRCRSVRRPKFNVEVLGERPSKPTTERTLLREFSSENGLSGIKSYDDLPRKLKGDFNKWSRVRIREVSGPISGDVSYTQWLRSQSNMFQEDVLGVSKAKLFREGNLHLDRFVDQSGREYTLGELAKREIEAFKAAGLDVESFVR